MRVCNLLLSLLLAASVAGFQFFVTRHDGRGLCVSSDDEGKELVPLYNIFATKQEKLRAETASNAPHSYLEIISLGDNMTTAEGSDLFVNVIKENPFPQFLVQAVNATLIWSENENWRIGRSFRLHMDHLDPEQGRKSTWVEYCTDLHTTNEKCLCLEKFHDRTNGPVLYGGKIWTWLYLYWDWENLTLYTEKLLALFKWSGRPIDFDKNNLSNWFAPKFLFAQTDSQPGIFLNLPGAVEGQTKNAPSQNTFRIRPEGEILSLLSGCFIYENQEK